MSELSMQVVDAILSGDKDQFNSAFENAIASKVSDALEVRKVEIASNFLNTEETPAVEVETTTDAAVETTETPTEQ